MCPTPHMLPSRGAHLERMATTGRRHIVAPSVRISGADTAALCSTDTAPRTRLGSHADRNESLQTATTRRRAVACPRPLHRSPTNPSGFGHAVLRKRVGRPLFGYCSDRDFIVFATCPDLQSRLSAGYSGGGTNLKNAWR